MTKGIYTYFNELSKESKDVFVSNNDDEAKLKFTNDMNQMRENFARQKVFFPMEKLFLYKLATLDTELPQCSIAKESTVLMCAADCPAYDDDAEETETK